MPTANVQPIADHVSYEQAAAVPTVFLPMWNMLIRRARLKPWETALVLSASAGVGTAAIQVAKKVVGGPGHRYDQHAERRPPWRGNWEPTR